MYLLCITPRKPLKCWLVNCNWFNTYTDFIIVFSVATAVNKLEFLATLNYTECIT
jgi:hypothetical protein